MDVLSSLWSRESATTAEVLEDLADRFECEYAYTTVLSLLRTLVRKGWAAREKVGHAHRYGALLRRDVVQEEALRRLRYSAFLGDRRLMIRILESWI